MTQHRAKHLFLLAAIGGFIALVGAMTFPILAWRRWFMLLVAISGLVLTLTKRKFNTEEKENSANHKWHMLDLGYDVLLWLALMALVLLV